MRSLLPFLSQESQPVYDPLLGYLAQVDSVIVKQSVELLEALTGFETQNKYILYNSLGQPIYYAAEDSNCLCRQSCGAQRSFTMHITDLYGNEVLTIERPFKFFGHCHCLACCNICRDQITVTSGGRDFGRVVEACSCFKLKLEVQLEGVTALYIIGPCCVMDECCCKSTFTVYGSDGETEVGCIVKKWSGLLQEFLTDADTFGVSFPLDLDVRLKACLLAATFLIDFIYFEKQGSRDSPELIDSAPAVIAGVMSPKTESKTSNKSENSSTFS